MSLIGLLVFLIIIGLIFWATQAIAGAFGIPKPIVTIVYVVLVIIVVLYLLQAISGGGLPTLRLQ